MAAESDIQAVLGALVTGRCYPLLAPANVVKPYITYQVISNVPSVTLDGPTGTENRRLQIDIFDKTYSGVKVLEESAKAAMAIATVTNVPLSTGDLFEGETQLYRVIMDYSIWTVPSS